MNRRGHLSRKIPNVKLRPQPRRSARRAASPPSLLDDEILNNAWRDAEESNAGPSAHNDRPWRGICVTFTGVEEKVSLGKMVVELGGTVESALTVQVTHVVAQGYGSPKYLYAVENRLPVLGASWIYDAHARWLQGDELDVPASIKLHRLQPFVGLKIAVTGIDNIDNRKRLIKFINGNGGVYAKDLGRDCTHLVSAFSTTAPEAKSSEKMKWALKELGERDVGRRRGKKYDTEDLFIVYESWLWDCIAYRGRWLEETYDARQPRGRALVTPAEVIDGSAFRNLSVRALPPQEEEDDAPVVVRKRKREGMDSLVGELMSTAKPADVLVVSSTALKSSAPPESPMINVTGDQEPVTVADTEAVELPRRPGAFDRKPSLLHASRSTAFSAPTSASGAKTPRLVTDGSMDASSIIQRPPSSPNPQYFAGLRFSIAITSESNQPLESALSQHGGDVISEEDRVSGAHVDYVIVKLHPNQTWPEMPAEEAKTKVVTSCWIESCRFHSTLLSPDSNIVFRPLAVSTPIANAESMCAHISGFTTEQAAHLRRLLKALGGRVSEKLSRQTTTHLICAAPEGIKYKRATEWGKIVVQQSWLWAMATSGHIEPVEEHLHTAEAVAIGERHDSTATAANGSTSSLMVPGATASPSSLPPSRMLKLTPTHIDEPERREDTPLTPSKRETRVLNRATASPSAAQSRSASVPSTSQNEVKSKELKPAATMPGGASDVTAALRRLAEADTAPQRSKLIRRPRPSRPKIGSESTPSVLSSTTSPIKPAEKVEPVAVAPPIEDESMRVTYADPVSEKERKRLLDAVMRGTGGSPAKRTRM